MLKVFQRHNANRQTKQTLRERGRQRERVKREKKWKRVEGGTEGGTASKTHFAAGRKVFLPKFVNKNIKRNKGERHDKCSEKGGIKGRRECGRSRERGQS